MTRCSATACRMLTQAMISIDPEDAPADAKELRLLSEGKQRYSKGFPQWFPSNWHIWSAFCQQADIMWRKGREHYSSRTIIEYSRHNCALADVEENFKINNNYAQDLAHLYMAEHPDGGNFFELRQMPTSVRED